MSDLYHLSSPSPHVTQPVPVSGREYKNHGISQHGERNAGNEEILGRNISCAVGDHILRSIHRQDVAKADGILKNHGHAQYINARRLHALKNCNDNRDHGRCQPCGTGKAQMDNGEEEGQHRNDYKRRHGFHAEEGHEMIGQPDGSPRFQKSRAQTDAYAEKGNGAPVDMGDCLFPGHKSHFRKHHEHNAGNGDGGGIKGMKFLLRYPEEKEIRSSFFSSRETGPRSFSIFSNASLPPGISFTSGGMTWIRRK